MTERPTAPQRKRFYGSVTVSERGQIVIPASARRDFGIQAGDKLLVLGDLEQGIGIATLDLLARNVGGAVDLLQKVNQEASAAEDGLADDDSLSGGRRTTDGFVK